MIHIEQLELIRDATSKQDLVPILNHFCFTGSEVFAYDDKMAVSAKCVSPLACAVPAEKFYGFIKSFGDEEIEFDKKDSNVLLKGSGAKVEIACLEADSFIFEMPDNVDYEYLTEIGPEFIEGLELCMKSVSTSYLLPVFSGITVEIENGMCYMHSCEVETLSRYEFELEAPDSGKFILDGKFCRMLIKNFKKAGDEPKFLFLNDDSVMVELGNCTMYCKLPSSIEHDLRAKFEETFNISDEGWLLPIPDELKYSLDRSILSIGKDGICRFSVTGDILKIETTPNDNKKISATIDEDVELSEESTWEAEILINPSMIKKLLNNASKFAVVNETLALADDSGKHKMLVSTYGE